MEDKFIALIEQHRNEMASLQPAEVAPGSIFASVLAEFSMGEEAQALGAVLDSIENILQYADAQQLNIFGEQAFPLLRALVNVYYAGQDIDIQDRGLSLLARLLFRISRSEIDRQTAEEIIRIIGIAQRGISEESRNFHRFLQILLAVMDILTTDQSLSGRRNDLIRSLNRILRENRNRQVVSDALAAVILLSDYLEKSEKESLLKSMVEPIKTDHLEIFRRCLQVIICFAGGGTASGEGKRPVQLEESYHPTPVEDEINAYMAVRDEDAITAVPDQIAQAVIDRLPRPEFSVEIVQRLGVLFPLIAPADSQQRAALMDMIVKIVGSDNYVEIESILRAFRPLYPQLAERERVVVSNVAAGLFNRGDLRFLDLAVAVLDVFAADLSAVDQTPIAKGLVRAMQSDETPRIQAVLERIPASYGSFHPERREEIRGQLITLMRGDSLDYMSDALACATTIWEANDEDIQGEMSEAIASAMKTVLHETDTFPLAEAAVETVVARDYLRPVLDNALGALERFRNEQGREDRIFELATQVTQATTESDISKPVLPRVVPFLASFAVSRLHEVLAGFQSLLQTDYEPAILEIRSHTKNIVASQTEFPRIIPVVQFILNNQPLIIGELVDAASITLCSQELHEGGEVAFQLAAKLYSVSSAESQAREAIANGLRDAAANASSFEEVERVATAAIATPELPHFPKEELEEALAGKLLPFLRAEAYQSKTLSLLQELSAKMTHGANRSLREGLSSMIEEVDLPLDTFVAIMELVSTVPPLQIELPEACATKLARFARIAETSEAALALIDEKWENSTTGFKSTLTLEMQPVVESRDFTYTDERYQFLIRFIVYIPQGKYETDSEALQLGYIRALMRMSNTRERLNMLYELVKTEANILNRVRVALGLWILLTPLAQHIPYSKVKSTTDGWQFPAHPQLPVGRQQISVVFDELLTGTTSPLAYAQMRRNFLNALGQLADAEDEDVVELGEELFSEFSEYVASLPDEERKTWEAACQQVWVKDARKGTPDIDKIRSGKVRRTLRNQIKEIFADRN